MTFNILCQTLELGFYWAHKLDILQQFLSWPENCLLTRVFWEREYYLGEHADDVGVEGVLLFQLCVGGDGVVHGNRSFPLTIPAYSLEL